MNELSIEGVQKNIIQMLGEHHTVTISTRDESSVWSATVFYVSDQDMNLFFLSSEKSKHINHIQLNSEVSAAIYKDQSDWQKIKGIRLSGMVDILEGLAREKAMDQYLEKYKFLNQVINEPRNKDEEKIGSQFISIPFFKLKPSFIRIIDNEVAFGHKKEIRKREGNWELL